MFQRVPILSHGYFSWIFGFPRHLKHTFFLPPPLRHHRPKPLIKLCSLTGVIRVYSKPREELDRSRSTIHTLHSLLKSMNHSWIRTVQINKANFFSICRIKTSGEIVILICLKYYFKHRNIYWLKFKKIWMPWFLEVLEDKNQDCPDKIIIITIIIFNIHITHFS